MTAIGLGIGLAFQQGGGGGGFDPAELYASGEEGLVYDPSDLSTMWKDTAGTDPVTADGDLVARIDDKSGNGHHLTMATSGQRPLYKTDGTYHWLKGDGTDDFMEVAGSTSDFIFLHDGTGSMIAVACERDAGTTTTAVVGTGQNATHYFARLSSVGGAAKIDIANGTSKIVDDTATSEFPLNTAIDFRFQYESGAGDDAELLRDGVSVSAVAESGSPSASASSFDLRVFKAANGSEFEGRIYGMIIRDAIPTAGEATNIDAWLAERHA